MNVIIPVKRRDKGSSFNKLVSYISDRGSNPKADDELGVDSKNRNSQTKKAVFDRLVDYIDRHDGDDRAVVVTEVMPDGRQRLISSGVSCETNCFSWETAAAEMNMVAGQNRRCKDPVYQFILSWRENELPTDAQIFESAEHCIRQLGMEGHQYVTAIHQDTDNTHCHIAVNRVNPSTYKAANLWNDADILQKSCRVLERKYGFIQDNGSWEWGVNDQLVRAPFRFSGAPQGAVPLQVFSNTESLYHYAVEHARDRVSEMLEKDSFSWDQAHLILHSSGLGLREQGEGLVVYDVLRPEGTVVKASSVHPTLTKANLEPYLGRFQGAEPLAESLREPPLNQILVKSFYQPQFELRDKRARFERRQERAEARLELKQRYKNYRASWIKPELNVLQRKREIGDHFRALKADLRTKFKDPLMRKLMYRVAEFERMKAMAELRIQIRSERQILSEKGLARPLPYRVWVENQALSGDTPALSQLRGFAYREKRQQRRHAREVDRVILCAEGDDAPIHDWHSHTALLRRDGAIDYVRNGVIGVRDEGDRLFIREAIDGTEDVANFDLAMAVTSHKSGENIAIQGEVSFMKETLHALSVFNHEYDQSRFEPTRDDQKKYLEYLETVESPSSTTSLEQLPDPEQSRPGSPYSPSR